MVNLIQRQDFDYVRLLGKKLQLQTGATLLFLNVYLPVNCPSNYHLLNTFASIILNHNGTVIVVGDYNISPSHHQFNELLNLCSAAAMKGFFLTHKRRQIRTQLN